MQNTRSAFAGPRPSPSFPSLAVYAHQLPVACSTFTASNGKLGKGLGKKLVARVVSAYQSSKQVYCNLSFSSVVFYKSTALLYGRQQNGQQVADKSKRNASLPTRCCYTLHSKILRFESELEPI